MPFLIRIILQRLLILFYSFLAFLGIAPEANIPTEEEARISIEERQEDIGNFFRDKETKKRINSIVDGTQTIVDEIEKVNINLENNPKTSEVDNTANKAVPEVDNNNTQNQSPKTPSTQYNIEDVTVNIVCSKNNGNLINVSTGSGVIIDPKGVIITNAHVGQFVLLEDQSESNTGMKCGAYKENIPTFGYTMDVLHISPDWVEENFNLIKSENPKGTGEFDYAFLYITGNTNPAFKKPSKFPYSNISLNEDYNEDEKVIVAGYPGAPQNIVDIAKSGILKKDNVFIKDVFTFNRNTIDIFSTTKSNVGAKGASGGGVFKDGNLIGIISTTNGTQNNAEINAITTTYINNDLKRKTGKDIDSLIDNNNLYSSVLSFSKDFGFSLARLLFKELE